MLPFSMVGAIKTLYPVALAEGEGVGTAYEYAAKARIVAPLVAALRALGGKPRILVAGLPEKYGTSLDFAVLADRIGAEITVVDDRPGAIDRARRSVEVVRRSGRLLGLRVTFEVADLAGLGSHAGVDAVLSSEVLQRVAPAARWAFTAALRSLAPLGAVFVPNSENASHLAISGLAGMSLAEMRHGFGGARVEYVDMPPFPPGIARNDQQREKASTGTTEAVAMAGLDVYCAAERFVPNWLKRHFAHIVCAAWGA
ncbi:MAG: methyltransferase domain-containing protein [Polyangiaceae bacterium]